MKTKLKPWRSVAVLSCALTMLAAPAAAQEVTLRAVNAFQEGTYFARSFEEFVKRVNEEGKGKVQIQYLGGPKAVSPGEHGTALRRGVIDMANTAVSYVANLVPEAMLLTYTTQHMEALRRNGTIDYLNQSYLAKGMYYLGRSLEGLPYHIYTNKKVEGVEDFSGLKLRGASIYRNFFQALGVTMVQTQAGEVFTALERGVVDGYAWPLIGIFDFGWQEKTKYRIDPGFYAVTVDIVMSKTAWEKLTPEQRDFLERQVARLEAGNLARARVDAEAEMERMDQAGLQPIRLSDEASRKFLEIAHASAWEGMARISPEHTARLRELLSAE